MTGSRDVPGTLFELGELQIVLLPRVRLEHCYRIVTRCATALLEVVFRKCYTTPAKSPLRPLDRQSILQSVRLKWKPNASSPSRSLGSALFIAICQANAEIQDPGRKGYTDLMTRLQHCHPLVKPLTKKTSAVPVPPVVDQPCFKSCPGRARTPSSNLPIS